MAKKKDTVTMYIRDVPNHLWSEVDAYCKEQGLNRRDFIQLAINTLKQKQPQDNESTVLFEAEQTAKIIERRLALHEQMAKLQARIRELNNPIGLMETGLDASTKSRMLTDFQNMQAELKEKMDAILPGDKVEEVSPSEQELQPKAFDGEQAVLEFKTRLRDSGFDLDAQLNKSTVEEQESKAEKSIQEENSIENPIDAFLRAGEEEGGPMVFRRMTTPELKAEVERIGKELEKRASKKSPR